jgi:xanthine dehydrogenase YagT iron-sulfur-binding subunit
MGRGDSSVPLHEDSPAVPGELPVRLRVNGVLRELRLDPRVTLLDALRERLGLTGTKKGCDQGACGACTVLAEGRRVLSCLTLAVTCEDRDITTIEGLGAEGALHPVQQAFIACDAFQCGFCTPGQILSAVALLAEGRAGSDAEIREFMSGNICRCGAYPNIVAAIRAVAEEDRAVLGEAGRAVPGEAGRAVAGEAHRAGL